MIRLMIKTHKETGLRYLCVTNKEDYEKYSGSGVYWSKHLAKHGCDLITQVIYESEEKDEHFRNVCLFYSSLYNVISSDQWANLVAENGNTARYSKPSSVETLRKQRDSIISFWNSDASNEVRNALSDSAKSYWKDVQHRKKRLKSMRAAQTAEVNQRKSKTLKAMHENMSFDEKKLYGKCISKRRLAMSEESKQKRADKIRESLAVSVSHREHVARMKQERKSGGNPAAKKVHWKGETFLTKKEFCVMIKERGLPYNRCMEMLDDPAIEDCYVDSQAPKKTPITCPYCGKVGNGRKHSSMKRYHFDNCKFKEKE